MKVKIDKSERLSNAMAAAAVSDDVLVRLEVVAAWTSLGRTRLYAAIAAGTFPKQIKCGPRSSRWRAGDVRRWIRQQAAA